MNYRQFDIWWIDLEPTRGAETRKKRPCLIVQSDMVNQQTNTLLVAPILPGHKDWPFVFNVSPSRQNGIDKDRHVNLKQMRAVDVSRCVDRQGRLEKSYLRDFRLALSILFAED